MDHLGYSNSNIKSACKYLYLKYTKKPYLVIGQGAILYFEVGRREGSVTEAKLVVFVAKLVVVVDDELGGGQAKDAILRIPGDCARELDLAFKIKLYCRRCCFKTIQNPNSSSLATKRKRKQE